MSEIITERLKKLMAEKRYSKAEISDRLGIGYSTLWRRLNGERSVNVDFLSELAKILDTSVSYLIGETDNPERGGSIVVSETHSQAQNVLQSSQTEPAATNYAYWGGVVDEAHKVVERGNVIEIAFIESLLKLAYDTVTSGMDKVVHNDYPTSLDKAVVAQMPVYGGYHNKNSLTVGATA